MNDSKKKDLIKIFKIDENIYSFRVMNENKKRFEIEFNLEKGSSENSYIYLLKDKLLIIHPPPSEYFEIYLKYLKEINNNINNISIITGHINPKIIEFIYLLNSLRYQLSIVSSAPGAKLINELWEAKTKSLDSIKTNNIPNIDIIKKDQQLIISDDIKLNLMPCPSARWPGSMAIYDPQKKILYSEKIFAAHIYSEQWAEQNTLSTEIERKHFYDCLIAPMASQIDSMVERIYELDLQVIAPIHGPAIEFNLNNLFTKYLRWGENIASNDLNVVLLYASAYGNTAAIGDAIARGICRTDIKVISINCEFASTKEIIDAINNSHGYLIGSPTLAGHAPTPIVSALGNILANGDKKKPVGVFGSFGWSGEAIDLLESKLKDGGFKLNFESIRIKFRPNKLQIKEIEEIGTQFGRRIKQTSKRLKRKASSGMLSSKTDPSLMALGRIVGSLCILTASKKSDDTIINSGMLASWISQASFNPPGISVAVAKDRAVESLLQNEDKLAINILGAKNYQKVMKQFLKPFAPGENRFKGLDLEITPQSQLIIPESIAWLEATVKSRMECGDHVVIYAEINCGSLMNQNDLTAVHHRKSGENY
tara:strand:- start:544 stop:2328 length:1785 start_codon:yes stop_codon:yes gene_type:complete